MSNKQQAKEVQQRLMQMKGKIIITCIIENGVNVNVQTNMEKFSVIDTEVFIEYLLKLIEEGLVENILGAIDDIIKQQ